MYTLVECALPYVESIPEINIQRFDTLAEARATMKEYYNKKGLPYNVLYDIEAMQAYDEYGLRPAYYWRIFDDADI